MDQDWNPLVIRKRAPAKSSSKSNEDYASKAEKAGYRVETVSKHSSGNTQHASTSNARKVEDESEDFHVPKVSSSLKKAIADARKAKGMTQKELATKINEKVQVVQDYEAGKAIPNNQIVSKIERALGTKVRQGKKGKKGGKKT